MRKQLPLKWIVTVPQAEQPNVAALLLTIWFHPFRICISLDMIHRQTFTPSSDLILRPNNGNRLECISYQNKSNNSYNIKIIK
jgi:hypothetical protein